MVYSSELEAPPAWRAFAPLLPELTQYMQALPDGLLEGSLVLRDLLDVVVICDGMTRKSDFML